MVDAPAIPVLKRFFGKPGEPDAQAWALQDFGYEHETHRARPIAAVIDQAAHGALLIREAAKQDPRLMPVATGVAQMQRGLVAITPPGFLTPLEVTQLCAHANALDAQFCLTTLPETPAATAPHKDDLSAWRRLFIGVPVHGEHDGLALAHTVLKDFSAVRRQLLSSSLVDDDAQVPARADALDRLWHAQSHGVRTVVMAASAAGVGGEHILLVERRGFGRSDVILCASFLHTEERMVWLKGWVPSTLGPVRGAVVSLEDAAWPATPFASTWDVAGRPRQHLKEIKDPVHKGILDLSPLDPVVLLRFGPDVMPKASVSGAELRQRIAHTASNLQGTSDFNPRKPPAGQAAKSNAERALMGLRFTQLKCRMEADGIVCVDRDENERRVAYSALTALRVYAMPPDKPYEKALVLDLLTGAGPPLRLVAATVVNFKDLPGGPGAVTTESFRRFCKHLSEKNPSLDVDATTRPFLAGKPPHALLGMAQFAKLDAAYG